ncbi:MAG: sigma-54-dependent Fis family transcriptional regulator [Planctomycetota bacterium]|nr:MAG: sigma-54-dependent Fis family transcriptional regulator [Planctomycetota bacterium]
MESLQDLQSLRVLVVDDEDDIRLGLKKLLASIGIAAREAASGEQALQLFHQQRADLVLTDLMMPGMSGAELLSAIKEAAPETSVVLLTGFGTVSVAVQCMQAGAAHFLTKPFDNQEILGLIRRLGGHILAQRRGFDQDRRDLQVVAQDPAMLRVFEVAATVAQSSAPVLISGESGTGKEVIANFIHRRSPVSDRAFQAVNCAALSESLLESELFGHRKGAFTGADRDRAGLFVEAGGGTVFLDEVASMPASFQAKLLRVLQEKRVRPVGGSQDVAVDFRLIAATNRDLETLVQQGLFREDLFYRLKVVHLHIPPLRNRKADIVPLAGHFLARFAQQSLEPEAPVPEISEAAQDALYGHAWPGNVRELENAVQRATIVCCQGKILPFHLGLSEKGWNQSLEEAGDSPDYSTAKKRAMEQFQRQFVQRALEKSRGNVSQAASACGMTRVALQKILRQLGIDRREFS